MGRLEVLLRNTLLQRVSVPKRWNLLVAQGVLGVQVVDGGDSGTDGASA